MLHDGFHLHKAGSFVFQFCLYRKACWRSDIGCSWGCRRIPEARQSGHMIVLVFCFVFCFFFGLSRHRCLSCRRLILILNFPFKVVTVLPILLLMKVPGIMMHFYDIPMFTSCPSTFLLFFFSFTSIMNSVSSWGHSFKPIYHDIQWNGLHLIKWLGPLSLVLIYYLLYQLHLALLTLQWIKKQ